MNCFIALGERVAREWERQHCHDEVFPDIAARCMSESDILETVSFEEIARWFIRSRSLPSQKLREFGQPPLNVYQGRDFYIELLLWLDTPTAIHQHSFSGAFGVLRGSSFQTTYEFSRRDMICRQLVVGKLRRTSSETLRRGEIRAIHGGDRFIHSLLHLEPPSVTLVIRTRRDERHVPQYTHQNPGLAVDPFYKSEPMVTQLALMDALQLHQPALFQEMAEETVRFSDLFFAFKVVELVGARAMRSELFERLLCILHERHEGLASVLRPALDEWFRNREIQRLLRSVTNADHRTFLAVLNASPNRDTFRTIMRERFPDADPERQALAWIAELSDQGHLGLRFNELSLRILEFAIRGATFEDVEAAWRQRLARDSGPGEKVQALWNEFSSSNLIRPLVGG